MSSPHDALAASSPYGQLFTSFADKVTGGQYSRNFFSQEGAGAVAKGLLGLPQSTVLGPNGINTSSTENPFKELSTPSPSVAPSTQGADFDSLVDSVLPSTPTPAKPNTPTPTGSPTTPVIAPATQTSSSLFNFGTKQSPSVNDRPDTESESLF